MGEGLVDKLQQESEIELAVTWLPFELHPETPTNGVSLADFFGRSPESLWQMNQGLKSRAAEIGLPMEPPSTLFNTHGALLLAEYARDMAKAVEVHRRLFRVNFTEGRNLADVGVLREVAEQVGLDPDTAMAALENPEYEERIRRSMSEAQTYGVTGVPTFILEDRHKIVGTQPYEQLLAKIHQIQQTRP